MNAYLIFSGHYVPELAQLIVQSESKFNLKGIAVSREDNWFWLIWLEIGNASVINKWFLQNGWNLQIGNPLIEFNTDFNSRAEFFWSHGLISDSTYDSFTKVCNYSQVRRQSQSGTLTPVCAGVSRLVSREISRYVDTYDVTLDVCLSTLDQQAAMLTQLVCILCMYVFASS